MLDRLKKLEERADDLEQENLHLTQQVGFILMQTQPKPPAAEAPPNMAQPLLEPPPYIFRLNAAGCQCVTDLNDL